MSQDWRNIVQGHVIPSVCYCDQPYVVITNDQAWLCCITTSDGEEGAATQHVATMRSTDQGRTWSTPVRVEPDCMLENSYAVMLKAPSGRVFIFYNHNTDNVRQVLTHDGKNAFTRVDCLGHFVFKYSDDNGLSWSQKRYDIPFRKFACDLNNVYHGELCFFWNVGKAFAIGNDAYIPLIKVGKMGKGFYEQSEGSLLLSHNLFTEPDPEKIVFETLPDGDTGLRTPPGGDSISEEQSYVPLSDGHSLCATYRSVDGYPVECYSRDLGHTWEVPHYKTFADGRRMKHPRAANFVWRCRNGKYLYWFHNHGGHFINEMWKGPGGNAFGHSTYDGRNPVWLSAGVEVDSPTGRVIRWSEPEIVLYDSDQNVRMSYPDLIEDGGHAYLTETQKTIARVHEIPVEFLEGMWSHLEGKTVPPPAPNAVLTMSGKAPKLPSFGKRHDAITGVTFVLKLTDGCWGTTLIDAVNHNGLGFRMALSREGIVTLTIAEPHQTQIITSTTLPKDTQVCVITIDASASVVSFMADGRFLDGGEEREYGFQWLNPFTNHLNWAADWQLAQGLEVRIYNRPLRTYEAQICSGSQAQA